ncbi:unnamed protein product [Malus baccata var. baccata]
MAKRKREDNSTTSTMELNLLNNNKKQVHDHQPNTMKSRPIIFILRNASLTKGFVHKRSKILDSDDDRDFLLKQNKNLDDFSPAIVHQALREILDSKLNKAGMVSLIVQRRWLIDKYVNSAGVDDQGLVFVVGAMAHGKINEEYADDFMSGIQQVAAADAPAPSPTSDAFTFAPTFFASLAALAFGFFF